MYGGRGEGENSEGQVDERCSGKSYERKTHEQLSMEAKKGLKEIVLSSLSHASDIYMECSMRHVAQQSCVHVLTGNKKT